MPNIKNTPVIYAINDSPNLLILTPIEKFILANLHFPCDLCDKKFLHKGNMLTHRRPIPEKDHLNATFVIILIFKTLL